VLTIPGFTPLNSTFENTKCRFSKCYYFKNESRTAFGIDSTPSTSDPDHRFNPKTNTAMGSEGARVVTGEKQILQNPSLNFMDLEIF
jgi:hypothetical protein